MGKLFNRRKSAKPAAVVDSDSDTLSMMSEGSLDDLEEERAALRAALSGEGSAPRASGSGALTAAPAVDPFEQASLWAEVISAA